MSIPLTGAQFEISAGDYRATVTELGAGLRELHHRGTPVLAGYEADELPPAAAGQLLAPWPNRVDGGRYSFAGASLQLDLSEPAHGNAIHGLTRWANWVPEVHTQDQVRLSHVLHGRTGYPFCLRIEAEYRLHPDEGLQVSVTAGNPGTRPAPYGTGSHPYLTTGPRLIDECELTLPAASWLPIGDRGIPAGPLEGIDGTPFDFRKPRAIGATRLDHALTTLERSEDGRAWVRLAGPHGGVRLWAGEGYGWLQVFTGDPLAEPRRRRALAVEPMTCPPNAFATGTDLITIEPGGSVRHAWGIEAQPA
ncbi:MAG TPA: aldose 1-epimerase family protein [Streptosporangiaceae bacterium]